MMVISRTIVLETDDGRRRCFKVLRLDLYSRGKYERRKAMGKEDCVHSLLNQTAPTDWAVLLIGLEGFQRSPSFQLHLRVRVGQ